MGKHTRNSAQYLLRMTPETRDRLHAKADLAGLPLADAMRVGTEAYLDRLIDEQTRGEDPLLTEFRAAAAKIERRLRGS